ncbi:MAG: aminoglycoside phosphotransferase family protein [Actinomycetota bacterium]
MHDDEVEIDEALVRRLLAAQFPELGSLPLVRVEPWGTDHAIWRLGEELVLRLPRIHWATAQVELEHTWLPRLGPLLPVAVPEPVAVGAPGEGYPHHWALHRWLPGRPADPGPITDRVGFALALAEVVAALRRCPTAGAPSARGRARPVQDYDDETRRAIRSADHLIDAGAATAVWEEALTATPHRHDPVWVHGDLEGNCLLGDRGLAGIVDWGSACVGDPAVDVQVVWSPLFTPESREAFVDALSIDEATLARSRGMAVQQAAAALPYYLGTYPLIVERSWHKLAAIGVGPSS